MLSLCFVCAVFGGCSFFQSSESAKYILYPVKSGDTIYDIGVRFGVSYRDLLRINGITNPRELKVGAIVKIPYRGQRLAKNAGGRKDRRRASYRGSSKSRTRLGRAGVYVGRLAWPVRGARLSSRFGWRWTTFHEGIDLAVASGTPIVAAHSGKVVYSGNGLRGYGNLIIVKGDSGLLTVYAHNKRNLVYRGQRVTRGRRIAYVGSSGKATGPHLHFETRIKDSRGRNKAVDPLVFYPGR